MRRPLLLVAVLAVALFALMWGCGAFVAPYSVSGGWGMGPNTTGDPGPWARYGPGIMHGYGPRVGAGWNTGWRDLNLSIDSVKTYIDRWLAWQGNTHLKVGDVTEKDADTIVADIVTKDNSLVQRFVVNRHNGYFRSSED